MFSVLTLNFDKRNFLKFPINIKACILHIGYGNKIISKVQTTKFLGFQIGSNLNWKTN